MSESKFTKGPWHKDKWGTIYGPDNRPIPLEGVYLAGTHTEETAANRDLFFAAPELYEALKEARDCVAECANYESSDKRRPDRMQSTLKILEMVDRAIGKAEGRS
jgi:hypothetical protein